ncbi:hypothetical protein [Sneathiella litorea]|uniref:Uncharacterized protein n=1 Tax=Sneathiella litorea TaxID=2606216 RepID=A0A6L8W7Q5_9PROT|nr:hypothetical protein [Sneathiella litorea]MZR30277.1 hypothetical protein [Sneathiella litorea]
MEANNIAFVADEIDMFYTTKMGNEDDKSKINRLRDGAMSMTVGNENDGKITDLISVADENLYIVKENSIYRVMLADDIDPERTNINIPNSHQRIVSAGSTSPVVARSFLSADTLFNSTLFDQNFDQKLLMQISIDFMKELLAADRYLDNYVSAELAACAGMNEPKNREFTIPTIDDLEGQVKSYLQKIEHAVQKIYQLTKVFYDHNKKLFTGFAEKIEEKYGTDDNFAKFAKEMAKFMQFVRNARHCIEHPSKTQMLITKDFTLDASGQLSPPSIEIIHAETPQSQMAIADFMKQTLEYMILINETLMLHLSDKHMLKTDGFEFAVGFIPEEQRRGDTLVRVGYLININGHWQVLG